LAAGPVPAPATARPAPLPPPPPKPRPVLRPDEKAAIDAHVRAGKVTVVPTGATGVMTRTWKGEPVSAVPAPFPDAPDWAREAAVYLQKRNVEVVTNGTGRWLLDGRWSVSDVELVERANKKRAAQKLPPFVIPAGASGKGRGRAA
jgi:hypothetical protein